MGRAIVALAFVWLLAGCSKAPESGAVDGKVFQTDKGTAQSGSRDLTAAGKNAESRVGASLNK